LELVLGNFFDAIDHASTRGAIEESLGVGRTELEVGDDVGFADPDGEALKPRRGAYGLAMTGDERRTFRHTDSNTKIKPVRISLVSG
jgi:hypothetical protein